MHYRVLSHAKTTALAGLQMCATPPETMGLIGTGFEAVGHYVEQGTPTPFGD